MTLDQNRERGQNQPSRPPSLVRVELSSTLEPGGSTPCRLLRWNADTEDYQLQSGSQVVYDPDSRNYGLIGERFRALYYAASKRLEIIGSNGLTRFGKAITPISPGGQGQMQVWQHDPYASTGNIIDVENKSDTEIAVAEDIKADFTSGDGRWYAVRLDDKSGEGGDYTWIAQATTGADRTILTGQQVKWGDTTNIRTQMVGTPPNNIIEHILQGDLFSVNPGAGGSGAGFNIGVAENWTFTPGSGIAITVDNEDIIIAATGGGLYTWDVEADSGGVRTVQTAQKVSYLTNDGTVETLLEQGSPTTTDHIVKFKVGTTVATQMQNPITFNPPAGVVNPVIFPNQTLNLTTDPNLVITGLSNELAFSYVGPTGEMTSWTLSSEQGSVVVTDGLPITISGVGIDSAITGQTMTLVMNYTELTPIPPATGDLVAFGDISNVGSPNIVRRATIDDFAVVFG